MRDVMSQISFETLALSWEPSLVFQAGELVYANPPAEKLLEAPAPGTDFTSLFGMELPEADAAIAQLPLRGRSYDMSLRHLDDQVLVSLRLCSAGPLTLSDPMLVLLRDIQAGLGLSVDRIREEAEAAENAAMRESARSLTRDQFRLSRIVNNAAVAANLLAGRQSCRPKLCIPEQLCASVLEALGYLLPEVKTEAHLLMHEPFPLDADLFKLLLMNLLANSLDAGCRRLALDLKADEDTLFLSLSDDGCGIAPEELPLVFDRFRHDYALSEMRRGAGLGLTVARGIAQLHGGTLLLESKPGEGTTVRVSFRRPSAEPEELLLPEDSLF